MAEFFSKLFDTSDFPARWHCGNWTVAHGWLHIISDCLISLAYFAIPTMLFVLVRSKKFSFPRIAWLFIAFIMSCGITHAIDASIFWHPVYRVSGVMKAVTAVVSLATAASMLVLLPKALELPSIGKLNGELQAALTAEQAVREKLEAARAEIELKSSELVQKDHRVRELVSGALACGVQWHASTGEVIMEVGYNAIRKRVWPDAPFPLRSWRDLLEEDQVQELIESSITACKDVGWIHLMFHMDGHASDLDLRLTATAVQDREGEYTIMSGMFGLVTRDDETETPPDALA